MIKEYFAKFYKNLEMLEDTQERVGLLKVFKHAVCGTMDHFLYGSTITDYFELTFWNKSRKQKQEYMTWKYHKDFIYHVDDPGKIEQLASKDRMYQVLSKFVNRQQLDTGRCTYDEFLEFVSKTPQFFYKPNAESCGNGIRKYDVKSEKATEAFDEIKGLPAGTLDELIVQHHVLAELNPSSVNTIRIFTFRTDDSLYFTGAVLRIGTTGFVDNYSAGGVVGSIDIKTGTVRAAGENYVGKRFDVHPITGAQLKGITIPNWQDVLNLVYEAAVGFDLNYVAWDVAVCENKVTLIEANPAGMINVIQIADAGGKKRLYEKLTNEWRLHPYTGKNKELTRVYC